MSQLRFSLALLSIVSSFSIASPWEKVQSPSQNEPNAIGSYANGCLAGASALPLEGNGYQVLRSQRARYYGHPNAISFIERLAQFSNEQLQTQILVGDLSLPQGGRFSSGHSSHQTGLDIDIWLKLVDTPLSQQQLANPEPLSVVNLNEYRLVKNNWQPNHFDLIKQAASDDEVARIFVHPVIKQQLCDSESSTDREWLRKVRPWWGHHYHMHVRLNCPSDSTSCKSQAEPPKGDGCGAELASWKPQVVVTKSTPKKAKKVSRNKKVLPQICNELLMNLE